MIPGRILTVRQPWADLIMAGVKDVENRSWPVPSTLPDWWRCRDCGRRMSPHLLSFVCPGCGSADVDPYDGPFPFTIGIHAGLDIDADGLRQVMCDGNDRLLYVSGVHPDYPCVVGALLGAVPVTGCHHARECREVSPDVNWPHAAVTSGFCSRWAEPDVWHWTLGAPQPLAEPIPMKGRLGLWVPSAVRLSAEVPS